MSNHKKILLSVPEALISEIDELVSQLGITRSEFMREGLRFYVHEKKKQRLKELMKKGYQEMGEVNLRIAEESLQADNLQLENYLETLSE